jgi:hypothetical protein
LCTKTAKHAKFVSKTAWAEEERAKSLICHAAHRSPTTYFQSTRGKKSCCFFSLYLHHFFMDCLFDIFVISLVSEVQSQLQLAEFSTSEDTRELHKISQERDQAWESARRVFRSSSRWMSLRSVQPWLRFRLKEHLEAAASIKLVKFVFLVLIYYMLG